MTDAAKQAAYGLRDVADQYVASKMILGASNTLGVIDGTAATNVCCADMFPFIKRHCRSNAATLDSSSSMSLRTAESSYLPQEKSRSRVINLLLLSAKTF